MYIHTCIKLRSWTASRAKSYSGILSLKIYCK